MGTLVRACEACYDAAKAYGTPFISGKDSLHNQFTVRETGEVIRIPNTLLISAIGVIEDVHKCVTMDFKRPGNVVVLVRTKDGANLTDLAATHRAIAAIVAEGHVAACHDVSDGGWLTAAAEMCIASGLGLSVGRGALKAAAPFEEGPGGYLLEIRGGLGGGHLKSRLGDVALAVIIGDVHAEAVLVIEDESPPARMSIDELTSAWRGALDW
jgi:phosphoribosylformylglycinamidine synthase